MNLLDIVKNQVIDSLSGQASSFLGVPESNISTVLNGIFPSLLGKMIDISTQADGAQKILDMASGTDVHFLNNISELFSGGATNVAKLLNSGSGVLNLLLGSKTGELIDNMAELSGLKGSVASSLVKMAAPFLMAVLSKQIKENNIESPGLIDLLSSQNKYIIKDLPESVAKNMGFGFLEQGEAEAINLNVGNSNAFTKEADNIETKGSEVIENSTSSSEIGNIGNKSHFGTPGNTEKTSEADGQIGFKIFKWLIATIAALALLCMLALNMCSP